LHPSSLQLSFSQLSFLQAWYYSPPIFNLGLTIHQLPQVAQAGQRKLQKFKNIFLVIMQVKDDDEHRFAKLLAAFFN